MRLRLTLLPLAWFSGLGHSYTTCTLVPDPSPSCGVAGTATTDHAATEPQVVETQADCAALCARRRDQCKSFEYDEENENAILCTLSSNLTSKVVTPQPGSKQTYYDLACWDCGSYCSRQNIGENVIDNGDFEQPYLGPWSSKNGEIVPGKNSSQAYGCKVKGRLGSRRCQLQQVFNNCIGRTYAYQFDFKATDNTGLLVDSVGGPNYYFPPDPKLLNKWRQIKGVYQMSETAKYETYYSLLENPVNIGAFNPSKIFRFAFDNVQIVHVPAVEPPPPGTASVIKNGGFESGTLAPWKKALRSPRTGFVTPGLRGSTYAYSIPANDVVFIQQNVTTVPNTLYRLSYDFKSDKINQTLGRGTRNCYMQVYCHDDASGTDSKFERSTDTAALQTISEYYHATSSKTEITVYFFCIQTRSYIDNIRMVPISSKPLSYLKKT